MKGFVYLDVVSAGEGGKEEKGGLEKGIWQSLKRFIKQVKNQQFFNS